CAPARPMRFNCQSCGAKYQIADEKVAGKTVRMKCRKCGTEIQVRARPGGEGVEAEHVASAPASSRPGTLGAPPPRPSQPSGLASTSGPVRPGAPPAAGGAPRPGAPRPMAPRPVAPPRPAAPPRPG